MELVRLAASRRALTAGGLPSNVDGGERDASAGVCGRSAQTAWSRGWLVIGTVQCELSTRRAISKLCCVDGVAQRGREGYVLACRSPGGDERLQLQTSAEVPQSVHPPLLPYRHQHARCVTRAREQGLGISVDEALVGVQGASRLDTGGRREQKKIDKNCIAETTLPLPTTPRVGRASGERRAEVSHVSVRLLCCSGRAGSGSMMKVMIVRERKGNREQVQNVAVKCAVVIATALVISIYLYAHHYHPYLPRDLPQDELDVINYLEYQRPFTPAEITSASLKHSIELARDTQGIAAVMLNWYVPFVFLLTLIYPPLPLLPAYLPDCLWMAATLRLVD